MRKPPGSGTFLGFMALMAGTTSSYGHSVSEQIGGYSDNQGLDRQRLTVDAVVDGKPGVASLSSTNFEVVATHDQFEATDMGTKAHAYDREVYGTGYRLNDSVSATASQTWDRLTDTRLIADYSSDKIVSSRTWGGGISHWIREETVRIALDLTRTILQQPLYQILDLDFQNVGNPTIASSTGATVAVRHLATPTTIVDYTVSRIKVQNRPDTNSGSVAVRQFLPPLNGAVHVTGTRAYNRGFITTATNYGQVDAWIGEVAYLQNLWQGGHGRLGYRLYKQDETTRAINDKLVVGSDTATVSMSQDLPKGAVDSIGVPLTFDVSGARYLNNVQIAATAIEAGVTAKF